MNVILLGTGGPRPDPTRQGPSLLVQHHHRFLLFDAGRGVATQIVRSGAAVQAVDPIFITHHHFDHIGGLGDLILSSWNLGRTAPLRVFGPKGTVDLVAAMIHQVYAGDIDFRLREAAVSGESLAEMTQWLRVREVSEGPVWTDGALRVIARLVRHGHGLGVSSQNWQCCGYRVEGGDRTVAVSGDSVDCPGLDALAAGADLLIICCYLSQKERQTGEGELVARHVLACSPQVGKIAAKAGVRKVVLTHIREKDEDVVQEMVSEIQADFDGEVIAGRDLMPFEV